MTNLTSPVGGSRGGGCRRALPGAMLLVVLAPAAALARWLGRRRRGDRVKIAWRRRQPDGDRSRMVRFELELDAPDAQESTIRRQLTEVAVRVAEMFAARRVVIHLLYRVPGEPDSIVVPVGPLVQSLGERLSLALTQHDLEARTVLWLALPHGLHVAQVADPMAYDPEAPGEPDRLVAAADAVWALALARAHGGASYVVRAVLFVPEEEAAHTATLLEDFKARLGTR